MKGMTSNNVIIPQAEAYLQISTIEEGKLIDVCCYYSPDITSNILLDNYVLSSNKFINEYCGQSLLKFLYSEEDIMESQQVKIKNQKLDDVTKLNS